MPQHPWRDENCAGPPQPGHLPAAFQRISHHQWVLKLGLVQGRRARSPDGLHRGSPLRRCPMHARSSLQPSAGLGMSSQACATLDQCHSPRSSLPSACRSCGKRPRSVPSYLPRSRPGSMQVACWPACGGGQRLPPLTSRFSTVNYLAVKQPFFSNIDRSSTAQARRRRLTFGRSSS